MNSNINLKAVGHASSLFLVITFTLCVGFDFLFPEHAMFRAWQDLLPGFEWISWKSFFIGLAEAYAYGWYFALIWVPIYNYCISRNEKSGSCCQ
jgi:cytochrome c biogenesis protein CcdA